MTGCERCNRTLLMILSPVLLLTASVLAQDTPVPSGQEAQAAKHERQKEESVQEKPGEAGTTELQKATQNPVASLISVPIQDNLNFRIGPFNRIQNVLNIQPVIPMGVSKDWNLIIRWITPFISQPDPSQPDASVSGLGDMQPTFFLSPKKTGKLIWGAGPSFVLPTATNSRFLGQDKFSIGPSIVGLVQPGHWTIGALVNNVWSVAGASDRADVNQMTLQYFVNYNLREGWFLTSSPILTADWEATNGGRWIIPVGGGVGRITRLGHQPVNISIQAYGNAVHPAGFSPWGLRMQIAFLYPKGPQKK